MGGGWPVGDEGLMVSSLNQAAFSEAVAQLMPVMRAVAVREVGSTDADDLVQEALLRAWRRRSTFREDRGSMKVWLVAILLDRARRRRTRSRPDAARQPAAASTSLQIDLRLDVERAVSRLPRQQRLAVTLYYLADMSVDEVATVLHIRPGSVKAHLSRARASLSESLESS